MIKKIFCAILISMMTLPSAFAGSPKWAWDQGSYEQDGTVTMDGEEYSINPTGTQSLTGKSVRQPPTVIVQSSTGGGSATILFAPLKQGNFGGDAYCASTFGPGYVMANFGEVASLIRVAIPSFVFWLSSPSNPNKCNNWSDAAGDSYGTAANVLVGAGGLYFGSTGSSTCSTYNPVPCIKR